MDMQPPAQYAQAPAPKPGSVAVDVSQFIPPTANFVTIIMTITPPTGAALAYAPGYEGAPVLFKGPTSSGELRVSGRFIYVDLISGATNFQIQYLNWREPT